ncbi:hypothetical protein INR49_022968 [Caranx melampygus]|nr:hypothetical protein INR49_022968 [Caranx melampygus]
MPGKAIGQRVDSFRATWKGSEVGLFGNKLQPQVKVDCVGLHFLSLSNSLIHTEMHTLFVCTLLLFDSLLSQ